MHDYKKLTVWQKSIQFATEVYRSTSTFPKAEVYGLRSQIRRSVISINSNLAEGTGRNSQNDFRHFLHIAYGSSCELDTQLIIAKNLGFLTDTDFITLESELQEIQKMLFQLAKSLK
jgi:four helix bundle protein